MLVFFSTNTPLKSFYQRHYNPINLSTRDSSSICLNAAYSRAYDSPDFEHLRKQSPAGRYTAYRLHRINVSAAGKKLTS